MMGGTWLDSEEKTKMARYSKYLDLVPIALLQEYGIDAILTIWPLRQISKKPRLHPYAVPWNDPQQAKFISHSYLRNDSNGGGGNVGGGAGGSNSNGNGSNGGNSVTLISNTTGLPIPSTSTYVPNLTLSLVNNNSNSNNNSSSNNIKVYRSRGVLNECNYSNSFKRIDTLGDKGRFVAGGIHGALIRFDGTRINNLQTLNSRTHLPSTPCYYPVFHNNADNNGGPVGRIINNGQRYSAVFYPPVRVFKGNQSKSLEQDERIRREKLRKLIFNCTVELSISSPLTCKLRERLSSILPKVPVSMSQGYEKFCTTTIRSQYSEYQPYHSHLHPQFKPSRTLRSNTSIVDEKTSSSSSSSYSSSSSSCYVHHYSFNRKQRHHRWSQIENKYARDSSQKRFAEKRKHEEIQITSGSDNSNDSEIRLNPNLVNWSPTPVISSFPMIDYDEMAQALREKEAHYNLENPPYVISFVPDDSKKSAHCKNSFDSSSLGYEIILEPMNTPSSLSSSKTTTVSSSSVPILTKLSDKTEITRKMEKHQTSNGADNPNTEVKIIQKSPTEQELLAPLRRSLRRIFNAGSNGVTRSGTKNVQDKSKSVCDITLSSVTDGDIKPNFSKKLMKTENVVVKHLPSSTESEIKSKSTLRLTRRNEEKIIPMEKTAINLRKVNHHLRQSKRTLEDEVMVIRAKDDLPRKKVATDDVVMIKVMKASKKPRLRK